MSEQIVGKIGEATLDLPVLIANKGQLRLPINRYVNLFNRLQLQQALRHMPK